MNREEFEKFWEKNYYDRPETKGPMFEVWMAGMEAAAVKCVMVGNYQWRNYKTLPPSDFRRADPMEAGMSKGAYFCADLIRGIEDRKEFEL